MNDIIQSLWIGTRLSKIEQLCIKSFLNHGNSFDLFVYNEVKDIPNGVTICDANTIIPKTKIFTSHNGSYAHFSDWFRWKLLYQKGNYWVDMDLIALKPLDFEENIVFGMEAFDTPSIGILKFPENHSFTEFMVEVCEHPNKILPYDNLRKKIKKTFRFIMGIKRSNIAWGEIGGPFGFKRALTHFNLLKEGKPYPYFYPISFKNWRYIFDDTFAKHQGVLEMSYTIHLWNEGIRRTKDFNVNKDYSKSSIYGRLLRRHNIM